MAHLLGSFCQNDAVSLQRQRPYRILKLISMFQTIPTRNNWFWNKHDIIIQLMRWHFPLSFSDGRFAFLNLFGVGKSFILFFIFLGVSGYFWWIGYSLLSLEFISFTVAKSVHLNFSKSVISSSEHFPFFWFSESNYWSTLSTGEFLACTLVRYLSLTDCIRD